MEPQRMSRLSSTFASRIAGKPGVASVLAQGSTPVAEVEHLGLPEGQRTYYLFVQTASGGTWAPKADEEGVYTLTLTGLPAQTVYFSDRPERIVGTQTTTDFLQALGFGEENPPNAALVTNTDGAEDILVIELFNPVYTEGDDETGVTLVYEARILENYHETNLGGVAELQSAPDAMPATFDGASLFIDDCQTGLLTCLRTVGGVQKTYGEIHTPCCYKFPSCQACGDLGGICNSLPGCEDGQCEEKIFYGCSFWG